MGWLLDGIRSLVNSVVAWFANVLSITLGWLLDLATAVWDWHVEMFEMLWGHFKAGVEILYAWAPSIWEDTFQTTWDYVIEYLSRAWTWFYDSMLVIIEWIEETLSEAGVDTSYLEQFPEVMADIADVYEDSAWLLPLNGVMALLCATLIASIVIRFVRWIISLIPWDLGG